jgi:hypothetical protein
MKLPRFSTSTLLLSVAVAAVSFGGSVAAWGRKIQARYFFVGVGLDAPLWLPITFVAFAVGRKALTVRMVVAFAVAEAAAVAFAHWLEVNGPW